MNSNIADIFFDGRAIGVIEFLRQQPRVMVGPDELRAFISESHEKGISRFRDLMKDGQSIIINEPVMHNDPYYQLAMIEWIRRHGYTVIERRPELDAELSRLVDKVKDKQLKQNIFDELPRCSYREKTMLLRVLKDPTNISSYAE